jgi:LacI family transcriptional regulator
MSSKPDVTIYDIAQQLSLSTSTVSRALKDHPAIHKNTRKKVQETARALGYRANQFASNLRQQKTHTIGVLVHELKSHFITSVLAGIEKITTEAGYDLIIAHSDEQIAKEIANVHNLFHKRVDGLIASLSFETQDLAHFQPMIEKGIPIVFFDRAEEHPRIPKVIIDNYKSGYEATAHLIQQGCKRIVLVTANQNRNVYAQRYQGYRDALRDHQLKLDASCVLIKDLSEQGGREAALEVLRMKKRPDAAFITNDFSAAVFMRVIKEHGLRVPEDMAIVGFNNDSISKLVEPQLSTIQYPGYDMGEIAARNLIGHLKQSFDLQQTNTIIVHSELIIRASSLRHST